MKTYDLDLEEVQLYLLNKSIISSIKNNAITLFNDNQENLAQKYIDDLFYSKLNDLLPVQFYYLLGINNFNDAIDALLNNLKVSEEEGAAHKYATYSAYLKGARFYNFRKTCEMYFAIKPKILQVNPDLDFDLLQLKTMWVSALLV